MGNMAIRFGGSAHLGRTGLYVWWDLRDIMWQRSYENGHGPPKPDAVGANPTCHARDTR